MLKVKIIKEESNYKKITMDGHAMYDDYGKDIVCAAASSIITTTINACIRFDEESLIYKVDKGYIDIDVNSNSKDIQTLLENMISLLKELESQYPKNIKLN